MCSLSGLSTAGKGDSIDHEKGVEDVSKELETWWKSLSREERRIRLQAELWMYKMKKALSTALEKAL